MPANYNIDDVVNSRHMRRQTVAKRATAKSTRGNKAAWKRPGSPIGKKGARKANPKSTRNMHARWSREDVKMLRQLAKENTPTRVIGLKLGRTAISIQGKAQREAISLRPTNQSPYNRRANRAPARRTTKR
jgi:hypothetical protein